MQTRIASEGARDREQAKDYREGAGAATDRRTPRVCHPLVRGHRSLSSGPATERNEGAARPAATRTIPVSVPTRVSYLFAEWCRSHETGTPTLYERPLGTRPVLHTRPEAFLT